MNVNVTEKLAVNVTEKLSVRIGNAIDSGIGLPSRIDKLRVFINKTLSIMAILSAYQQLVDKKLVLSTVV